MKNIKCRNCFFYRNEWCKKIADSPDPEEARDCNYFREMTNADRIRSMTDEELGVWICKHALSCGCCVGVELCRSDDGIANGAVKWLQQPAEEDDHD